MKDKVVYRRGSCFFSLYSRLYIIVRYFIRKQTQVGLKFKVWSTDEQLSENMQHLA